MSDWKLPWNASCLCERVTMRITAPPVIATACHCRGCQKLTSGPYSLTLMIPGDALAVEGETEIGALHKPDAQHHYCTYCKSWLYTTSPHLQGFVNFRATMLADPSWVTPYIESCVSEQLPNVSSGAKLSFDQYPTPDMYPELIAGFLREGAKPR